MDLVEPRAQLLGQPPGVGEDDGRAVRLDQVGDALLDVRPDGRTACVAGGGPADLVGGRAELGQVGDGDDHLELDGLARGRLHDDDVAGAAQEPGHLVDRADGRREPDPAGGALEQGVEAFQGQREMGAALGAGDGVNLVDDDGVDAAQRLAGLGGQQEEQRLRRGDEHVGRLARELAALVGGGVTGADGDADVGRFEAEPLGGLPDAGERSAEVALDVDGEGLERGDVEDATPVERVVGRRTGGDPVEGPEEGGQRLARAGGGDDEGVLPGGGRSPGALLGGGGSLERALEPRPRRRREQPERRGVWLGPPLRETSRVGHMPPSSPTPPTRDRPYNDDQGDTDPFPHKKGRYLLDHRCPGRCVAGGAGTSREGRGGR